MKQTAVEWLEEQIKKQREEGDRDLRTTLYYCKEAKEMEKKQQDEFAIGFAEWLTYNRENNYTKSTKELLEIYKKENKL